uniref:Uncharacterized protein n=1 Tax=Psilocybe cubensis TaxID=181762 RepID=A0A8H7XJZ7_PSICU
MSEIEEQNLNDNITEPPSPEVRDISHFMIDEPSSRQGVTVNVWRVSNTLLILGLGIGKTVAALQGQTIAPTILDWVLGVIWAIVAYWVSAFETESPESCSWLLKHNPRLSKATWWVILNTLKMSALFMVYSVHWIGTFSIPDGGGTLITVLRVTTLLLIWLWVIFINYISMWFYAEDFNQIFTVPIACTIVAIIYDIRCGYICEFYIGWYKLREMMESTNYVVKQIDPPGALVAAPAYLKDAAVYAAIQLLVALAGYYVKLEGYSALNLQFSLITFYITCSW